MAKDPMDNYISNAHGLAEELDELLDECDVREESVALFEKHGDTLFDMSDAEKESALKFLGRTAGQRSKVVGKLDASEAACLILRARYCALTAYQQLQIAQSMYLNVVGTGYRAAAEYAARVAINTSLVPKPSTVVRRYNPYARPRMR